jgi:2-iminobutanoate/2-iminopropanoate deaminase
MKKHFQLLVLLLLSTLTANLLAVDIAKQAIVTNNAPAAVGPYSQAIKVGNVLYLSGQIAIDPKTGDMNSGSIEQQTIQVLENIKAVLNASGYRLSDVVQSQVFLTDLENYKSMNKVYAEYFTSKPPARATVEVARLPLNAAVEIMVTAAR